jgi:hypothetical protein
MDGLFAPIADRALPPRPTRYASLLQAGNCDRRAILERVEQDAFASVLKAYARLSDGPIRGSERDEQLRFARDAKIRWARALADLDHSLSRLLEGG